MTANQVNKLFKIIEAAYYCDLTPTVKADWYKAIKHMDYGLAMRRLDKHISHYKDAPIVDDILNPELQDDLLM